jgi:hypothetical protein
MAPMQFVFLDARALPVMVMVIAAVGSFAQHGVMLVQMNCVEEQGVSIGLKFC